MFANKGTNHTLPAKAHRHERFARSGVCVWYECARRTADGRLKLGRKHKVYIQKFNSDGKSSKRRYNKRVRKLARCGPLEIGDA